jgi:adenosine deaminase
LTVCPFSNLALKVVERLEDHNIKRLLDKGLAVSINSDDPAYFGGYIAENYRATAQALGLTRDEVVRIARISLQSTFSPESDKQKWLEELDNYVRQANKQLLEEEGVTVETTVESETIALEDEVAA